MKDNSSTPAASSLQLGRWDRAELKLSHRFWGQTRICPVDHTTVQERCCGVPGHHHLVCLRNPAAEQTPSIRKGGSGPDEDLWWCKGVAGRPTYARRGPRSTEATERALPRGERPRAGAQDCTAARAASATWSSTNEETWWMTCENAMA